MFESFGKADFLTGCETPKNKRIKYHLNSDIRITTVFVGRHLCCDYLYLMLFFMCFVRFML